MTTATSAPLTFFPTRPGAPSRFTGTYTQHLFLLAFELQCKSKTALSLVSVQVMSFTDEFRGLDRDIEGSPKRWKKLVESECPEKEKFPQEWKGKSSLQKLIMMRALRPDRMTYALK